MGSSRNSEPAVSLEDSERNGIISSQLIQLRFGEWGAALRKLGIFKFVLKIPQATQNPLEFGLMGVEEVYRGAPRRSQGRRERC